MHLQFLSFIYFFLFSFSAFSSPVFEINSKEVLTDYLARSPFNGVVLVSKDNKILFKKAFGYKNLNTKTPLTVDDKFQIGSNTKQFVAASLLKLQEEGKLKLDDEISTFIPALNILGSIKVRDILNHSSGITNYTDREEFWQNVEYSKTLTLDDLITFALKYPLDFEPKTKWNYSNSGYVIAGKIIEVIAGKTWDQYIKENFLIPLEMKDTGYNEYFDQVTDVSGHIKDKGELTPFNEFNLSWALSAGALYSTVDDLNKWMDIYESSPILSQKSIAEMQTPFLANYGLGLWIKPYGSDTEIGHNGRTVGFVSQLSYLKNSKLKVITLDNVDGAFSQVGQLLLTYYSKGKTMALKLAPYNIDAKILNDYIGKYKTPSMQVDIFVESGNLFLKPNDGQPAYLLKANDKDSFNVEGFAGEEFIRNEKNIVIGIKHYQGGGITLFDKINDEATPNLKKTNLNFIQKTILKFKLFNKF